MAYTGADSLRPKSRARRLGGLASHRFPVFSRQLRCCLSDRLVSLQPMGFLNRRLACLAVSASSVPQTGRSDRGSSKSPLLRSRYRCHLGSALHIYNNDMCLEDKVRLGFYYKVFLFFLTPPPHAILYMAGEGHVEMCTDD